MFFGGTEREHRPETGNDVILIVNFLRTSNVALDFLFTDSWAGFIFKSVEKIFQNITNHVKNISMSFPKF